MPIVIEPMVRFITAREPREFLKHHGCFKFLCVPQTVHIQTSLISRTPPRFPSRVDGGCLLLRKAKHHIAPRALLHRILCRRRPSVVHGYLMYAFNERNCARRATNRCVVDFGYGTFYGTPRILRFTTTGKRLKGW